MAKKTSKPKKLKCRHKDCQKSYENALQFSRHQQVCKIRKDKLVKKGFYQKQLKHQDKTTAQKRDKLNLNDVKIINQIGSGGFGVVYSAKAKEQELVVKYISFQKQNQQTSFQNQLKVYEQKGPIPKIFGIKQMLNGNLIFLEKMELTLQQILKKIKFSNQEKCFLLKKIILILGQFHKMEFVHRDLKDNNIMFKNGKFYLIDFGNAGEIPADGSVYGSVYGDLRLMSQGQHTWRAHIPVDDLQNVCWMILQRFKQFPWSIDFTNYKLNKFDKNNDSINFQLASNAVSAKKTVLLVNSESYPDIPSQIIDTIKYLRKLNRSKPNAVDHRHIAEMVCPHIIDQNAFFNKIYLLVKTSEKAMQKKTLPRPILVNHFKFPSDVLKKLFIQQFWSQLDLPKSLFEKYKLSQPLSIFQISDELSNCNINQRHYKYIVVEKNSRFVADNVCDDDRLILVLDKTQCPHFYVLLQTPTKIISFNGIKTKRNYFRNLQIVTSKFIQKQTDDWRCGYIAFGWLKKILSFGIQSWLLLEQSA